MKTAVVIIALCLAISGCGFHLRGAGGSQVEFAGERIFVLQSRAGNLLAELRPLIAGTGAKLVASKADADYVLALGNEKMEREVLSVSPQTGKVEEYQLTYTVIMNVAPAADGKPLLQDERIMLQRDFTFDQDAVLGKFSEEELLRSELLREAAEQVLRRLGAALQRAG